MGLSEDQWNALVRDTAHVLDTHAPGWTDHNDGDPGVTLLQVFAFLAESLVYRGPVPEAGRAHLLRARERLGAAHALSCSTAAPATRVRYFAGQILSADDLQAEQDYFRGRLRRHNLLLHGVGVGAGLKVSLATDSSGPNVTVSPGYAIGPDGEEIVLCRSLTAVVTGSGPRCLVAVRTIDQQVHAIVTDSTVNASRVEQVPEVVVQERVPDDALVIAALEQDETGWSCDSAFEPSRLRGC